MRSIATLILFALLVVVLPAAAQDEEPVCDFTPVQSAIELTTAALAGTDNEATLTALGELSKAIRAAHLSCNGLAFTSEEYGQIPVLGPIDIPAGVYRATVTTEGFFIADVTLLDGECDDRNLLNVSEGQATEGGQAVFESEGCSILIEISNTREPWALEFEPVN